MLAYHLQSNLCAIVYSYVCNYSINCGIIIYLLSDTYDVELIIIFFRGGILKILYTLSVIYFQKLRFHIVVLTQYLVKICSHKSALLFTLRRHKCRKLIFTGCATDFCVDTTIRSAVSYDFNVVVASDCNTTAVHLL